MRTRCQITIAITITIAVNCAPSNAFRIAVARRGNEKSNLKGRTVRSLGILYLESRAPSGGVVEAGLGRDQHQVGAFLGARDREVDGCKVWEYFVNICFVMLQIVYLFKMTLATFSTLVKKSGPSDR